MPNEPTSTPIPPPPTPQAPTSTPVIPPANDVDFTIQDANAGTPVAFDPLFGFRAASGQTLTFVATSGSAPFVWEFGDGTSSTGSPAIHTYSTPTDRIFTVKLTAGASTKAYALAVSGSAPLSGSFAVRYSDNSPLDAQSVLLNKPLRFTSAEVADEYQWNFGDGESGTGAAVEHVYMRPGAYQATLTVQRAGVSSASSPMILNVQFSADAPQWLVAGMAFVDGAGGTLWKSNLSIFNPDPERVISLSMAFLDGRQGVSDASMLVWYDLAIQPLSTATYRNVLNSPPFNLEKGNFGAILIRGNDLSLAPVINGRTFNSGADDGTYGLTVPAVPVSAGVHQQASSASNTLIGLREVPGLYRTNITVANLRADYADAELRFYDSFGNQLGQVAEVTLSPYGVTQINRALSSPVGARYSFPKDAFYVKVNLLSGTAVFPYATVIDERSSDPIVVAPSSRPNNIYRLPGIVRTSGRNGTFFMSDVVLFNPSQSTRKISVRYTYQAFPPGQAPSPQQTASRELTLRAGEQITYVDFVKSWLPQGPDFEATNYANSYLDVSPVAYESNQDPLLVLGLTYNNAASGPVGFQVPGYTQLDGAAITISNRRLVMTGLSNTEAFRSNVAFFLTSQAPGAYAQGTVNVYDEQGTLVRTTSISLNEAASFTQLNSGFLFEGIQGDTSNVTVVLDQVSGTSAIASYASLVDNKTGDAILIAGQPAP